MNPWGKKNTGRGKHAGCPPLSQPRMKITLPDNYTTVIIAVVGVFQHEFRGSESHDCSSRNLWLSNEVKRDCMIVFEEANRVSTLGYFGARNTQLLF